MPVEPLANNPLVITGAGRLPVPVKGMVRVIAEVTTCTVADFAPAVAGLNATVIVQGAPPCGRLALPIVQVPPGILKSVPTRVIAFKVALPVPVTAPTKIVCIALIVPTSWLPNAKGDDVRGVPCAGGTPALIDTAIQFTFPPHSA